MLLSQKKVTIRTTFCALKEIFQSKNCINVSFNFNNFEYEFITLAILATSKIM